MISKKFFSEFVGTLFLLMVIVGSGIMGENLSNGNAGIALLANSIATGAGLFVLITLLINISGAHFNPVVSFVSWANKEIEFFQLLQYWIGQFSGAILGVYLAHYIFDISIIQTSTNLWMSEVVGTLILLSVIKIGSQNKDKIAILVALTITAGYWFTASTFFVNPAVTVARSLTNTFSGIEPSNIITFISAQVFATILFLFISKKIKYI